MRSCLCGPIWTRSEDCPLHGDLPDLATDKKAPPPEPDIDKLAERCASTYYHEEPETGFRRSIETLSRYIAATIRKALGGGK